MPHGREDDSETERPYQNSSGMNARERERSLKRNENGQKAHFTQISSAF
jgi:hypothetical protein